LILLSVAAHGVTGTWLDEIVEIGIPLVLFVGLYFWSNRRSRARRPPNEGREARGSEGAQPPQRR